MVKARRSSVATLTLTLDPAIQAKLEDLARRVGIDVESIAIALLVNGLMLLALQGG